MPCPNCHCSSCLALVGSAIPSAESSLLPSELITTNRAPTNSEAAYSKNVIGPSENMVSLIQSIVDDLEKRKAKLLGLIRKHKAAISPLRSFPPELLAEIFAQFVAMADRNRYSKDFSPLMLMRICSRWRRIILDTPQLWTRILTPHPMIDSWITRSKELPLCLELDLSPPTSYPALEALVPHSYRWQDVDFLLEPGSHSMLARVRNRLPSLKRLNISFSNKIRGTVDFCEVAPQLTEVGLRGIYRRVTIRLPWEQLRLCTVDNTEVVHYVLQRAENLWGLCLDMSKAVPKTIGLELPKGPHSLHPKLNTFTVKWNFKDEEMSSFFSEITLPSLRTLSVCFDYPGVDDDVELHGIDDDQAEVGPILAEFFERSCTHLSTLKLTKIPFPPDELIECLAFSPSLVSLDIEFDSGCYTIDEELLNGLNLNHPRPVLPRLRSLTFRGATEMYIEEPMDNLIASRRHINPRHDGVAMLENLMLESTFPRSIDDSGPPLFHRFVSEGLNIIYGRDWNL